MTTTLRLEPTPATARDYELTGPAGAPLVIVLGGISADAHVCATREDPRDGWWESIVGDSHAIDTRRFRVLGVSPASHDGVMTHTQADRIAATLDVIGCRRAHAIVGASYGGMVALAFAERHPSRVSRVVAISAAHESHPFARGVRSLQRRIVELGIANGCAEQAVAIARGLAVTTYRTAAEFGERFREPGAIESYLAAHGERFVQRCSPDRFLALSHALDAHRVSPERIRVPTTLVAVAEDTLVPLADVEALARRVGAPARLERIHSIRGHDAFLTEPDQIGRIVTEALA